ncbi:MAG: FecR family protein [Lentisphaeraceae bacterium]|nr:FecR family protein [Lentisphaeraceae bacterium]
MDWNDKEFDDLVSAYLEEALSESEVAHLSELLESDPEYAKRFLELSKIHSSLHELRGVKCEKKVKKTKSNFRPKQRTVRKKKKNSNLAFTLVFAAAAILILGLFVRFSLINNSSALRTVKVANISSGSELYVLTENGSKTRLKTGSIIALGQTLLAEGESILKYEGESTSITLKNGASLTLLNEGSKRVDLHIGQIICDVSPQAKPMELNTDFARATVLGTIFELTNTKDWSELAVLEGKVKWADKSGDSVIVNGGYFSKAGNGIKLEVKDLSKRTSNIFIKAGSGKIVGDGWKSGTGLDSLLFETNKGAVTNLEAQRNKTLGYVEYQFIAEGGKDYFVWVRGRAKGGEEGALSLSNHDMIFIEALTGKWDLQTWQVTPDWSWANDYIPSPLFNGFRSYVKDSDTYYWIGGPADSGTEDVVPWRFKVRFNKSGEQTVRVYGIEGPIELDRIWFSTDQSERPESTFRGAVK